MFKIIKTGQQNGQELHYVDFTSRGNCSSPPTLMMSYRNNGSKRRFVKVNEEMFVREIKKRPILYNTTMKDYKRFSTRHEAWSEVAMAMNLSEQECKKRWRSLRDAFMKVVRNKNEEEQKTWIHYRLLEFLLPYIGNNRMKKSKAVEFLEGYENDEEAEFIELEEDVEIYDGSRDPITVSYVTEDGKEVFQMLQDPDTIPEGAVIGIEETEEEDEGEEEEEQEVIQDIHHPIEFDDQENEAPQDHHDSESILYEERLDGFEASEQQLSQEEVIKQESHSEADVDEIHVEDIEMDLLISDHVEEGRSCPGSELPVIAEVHQSFPEHSSFPVADDPTVQVESITPTQLSFSSQTSQAATQPQNYVPSREESKSLLTPAQESQDKYDVADADERFLLSCAPILRRLSSKKNQLARLKFQQLLYELEYDEKYNS